MRQSWYVIAASILLTTAGSGGLPEASAQSEFLNPGQYGIEAAGFLSTTQEEGAYYKGGRVAVSLDGIADLGVSVQRLIYKKSFRADVLAADFTYHVLFDNEGGPNNPLCPLRRALTVTFQYARNITDGETEVFGGGLGLYAAGHMSPHVELIPALFANASTSDGEWEYAGGAGVTFAWTPRQRRTLYLTLQSSVGREQMMFGLGAGMLVRLPE